MPLRPTDALLMRMMARELRRLESSGGNTGTLQMIATLLDEARGNIPTPELTPARGFDTSAAASLLYRAGLIPAQSEIVTERAALGFSKDTYILAVTSPQGLASRLVVRRDLPASCTRTSVVDEYPLLVHLHRQGVPVAEPLFVEEDPDVLGGCFIVTRAAAGRPDVHTWETDPQKRAALGAELARILAQLHGLPLEAAPLPASIGASRRTLVEWLSGWRLLWEETGRPEWESVRHAYDYLQANLPNLQRHGIVHADYGLHNIMVENGRVTAVLDWEFAHAGDTAEDLAYTQGRLEGFVDWPLFLDNYLAAGGPPVAAERFDFYKIWRGVRNATCCAVGLAAFESGRNTDLRLAYAGRVLIHRYLGDLHVQLKSLGS
jgi:aminoglycoside phosphotransferase (APT) family kinase protein